MNDRFKFRVFISDKKNSKNGSTGMFKVHSLHTGTNKAIITSLYGNCSIKLENNILMQATGLKDKNGKLIYEGDIVKVGNGSINGSVIETTREVKWIINTWNVPVWVVDKPNFSHYVQVIGNIYENEELLNENS